MGNGAVFLRKNPLTLKKIIARVVVLKYLIAHYAGNRSLNITITLLPYKKIISGNYIVKIVITECNMNCIFLVNTINPDSLTWFPTQSGAERCLNNYMGEKIIIQKVHFGLPPFPVEEWRYTYINDKYIPKGEE